MSKVITFSRVFPSYHPKKGQPTYFVEKLYKSFLEKESQIEQVLTPISDYIYDVGQKLDYMYADDFLNAIENSTPKNYNSERNNRTGTRPQFWLYCVIGRLFLSK
jgi:hypothetical protein